MRSALLSGRALQVLVLACLLLIGVAGAGAKQGPAEPGAAQGEAGAGPEGSDVQRLVEILKDEERRRLLIQSLEQAHGQAGAEADSQARPLSDSLWQGLTEAGQEAAEALEQTVTSLPALLILVQRLAASLVLLAAGYFLWRMVRRYLLPHVLSRWPVKILSVVILGSSLAMGLLTVWGADVGTLLAEPPGRTVVTSLATIVFVVVAAYAAWEVINHILNRHVGSMSLGEELERRLQTVLPLARSALLVIICVITALVVLAELGINIAPLLAGAGIAGLAIGFGAQTLVKDLLTGFFVLLENTINVGDWVILGGHDGQVEGLTIRHVTVRDIYGNLHTVPWSSVVSITNQTRSFGYAVVEVGFAYRENIDQVVEVVKGVAREMRSDPTVSEGILSDLQVLGLIELGDSAVVVRTRFKTAPFLRWRLERDFRRRIKNRFDELGIEIPYPHQTIYFGQNKQGEAVPARVAIQKLIEPEQG